MAERKGVLLRLDPAVHDALARWAADELRSTNAQIEFLLRKALVDAGRMPSGVGGIPEGAVRPKTRPEPPRVPVSVRVSCAFGVNPRESRSRAPRRVPPSGITRRGA